jgi:hypothetical protein
MASKSVSETRFFDTDTDEDVGSLAGFVHLPIGAYVTTTNGVCRVQRLRLNLVESPILWIDLAREGNVDAGTLPNKS